ncbi:MAG: hypothetical protein ACYC09_05185 [Bacteroidota bacterium]
MKEEELLLEIEQAAQDMGLRIRYEKGDFDGGYCILRDENIIVVNKKLAPIKKCSVIAQALGDFGIDDIYMKPIVRTYVEDEIVRAASLASKNVIRRKENAGEESTRAEEESAATDTEIITETEPTADSDRISGSETGNAGDGETPDKTGQAA